MSEFKKYERYKETGVTWIPMIPAHWEMKKINDLFSERCEKCSALEFMPLSVTKFGVVPQLETAAKSRDSENRKKVLMGDFVINSRSDRRGSSGFSKYDGSVSVDKYYSFSEAKHIHYIITIYLEAIHSSRNSIEMVEVS